MAISQHTRFENHMDIASPETKGDAQKMSDFFDENPYDDDFEAKLSQVDKNMSPNENSTQNINESADRTAESAHIKSEDEKKGEKSESLALNPTMPPLPKVEEDGDEPKQEGSDLSNNSFSSPVHLVQDLLAIFHLFSKQPRNLLRSHQHWMP